MGEPASCLACSSLACLAFLRRCFKDLAWASLRPASHVRVLPFVVRILPLRVGVVALGAVNAKYWC